MKIYTHYYDIAIVPSVEIRNASISLSKRVASLTNVRFILSAKRCKPHISLFHIAVPRSRIRMLRMLLHDILHSRKLGSLSVRNIQNPGNALWLTFSKPVWIRKLHKDIVHGTQHLRSRRRNMYTLWSRPKTALQKKYIARYGSPYVKKFFSPHITLTSAYHIAPRTKTDLRIALTRHLARRSFRPSQIAVYQLGSFHTCHRRVFSMQKRHA